MLLTTGIIAGLGVVWNCSSPFNGINTTGGLTMLGNCGFVIVLGII
jgi:hypothetical protein